MLPGVWGYGHRGVRYWLNGAVPMAAALGKEDQPDFHAFVRDVIHNLLPKYTTAGLPSTRSTWFAAYDDQIPGRSQVWSTSRLMKALTQWAEANPEDSPVGAVK